MKKILAAAALAIAFVAAPAHAVRVTPAHSGSWYDPDYDKQGFAIEVLGKVPNGPERRVLVYWYTYDDAGDPIWAIGVGETEGNTIELTMQTAHGGARPPAQVDADDLQDFADMTFTFGTCHTAIASFTMAGSGETGEYHLRRLTQIGATTCTGGLGDEVVGGAEPVTIVLQMAPATSVSQAHGKVTFKLRPSNAELEVEVQKLPVGTYTLRVGGEDRGTFQVRQMGNNGTTKGEIAFSSPAAPGEDELDFDPRGEAVEVLDANGNVVLSVTLPAAPAGEP
ncbi:MAG TPA: hypothetical protein VFL14_12340 [Xanthomonadales bacterium]|nr:hypothetical protein [Xanthomonadales bacterium]